MQNAKNLKPLSELDEYEIAHDEPDVKGWKVKTSDNQECGKVDDLIVDTTSLQVRYLDVKLDKKKLNLSEERHVLIPLGGAQLDDDKDCVLVSTMTTEKLKKLAPYMRGEMIVPEPSKTPHQEEVKQFYGKRGGSGKVNRMVLSEEELKVGKRQKEAGEVDVHKKVETEHVSKDVPVTHEEVTVERRAVSPDTPDPDGISENETRIPLMAEEAVVEKRAGAKEEVVITKKQVQGKQRVEADLKSERVDVERKKNANGGGSSDKVEQEWPQIEDKIKARWSKLTDQDVHVPHGDSGYLAARVQERYGQRPQEAQRQVQEFSRSL